MRRRLIELRREKGLTQDQLARILHTTQSRISRMENNQCEISPFLLVDMARFFQTTPEYIEGKTQTKEDKARNQIIVEDINDYENFLLRYKSLDREHKEYVKLTLDYCYQKEQEKQE